jgi:hypothetical protein
MFSPPFDDIEKGMLKFIGALIIPAALKDFMRGLSYLF